MRFVRALPVLVLVAASAGLSTAQALATGGLSTSYGVVYASFQGGTSYLYNYNSAANNFTQNDYGQYATDSPAETSLPDGAVEFAFQANTSMLWYTPLPNSEGVDTENPVVDGSSPVIAGLSNNSFEIAYNAAGGVGLYGVGAGSLTMYTAMPAGGTTSPAIAATNGGAGWEVAWAGQNGANQPSYLWTFASNQYPGGFGTNTGVEMESGTSPAIAAVTTGGYVIAYVDTSGELAFYDTATGGSPGATVDTANDLPYGVQPGTSPAIAANSDGGWQIAFVGTGGYLEYYSYLTNYATNYYYSATRQSVYAGTSPTVTALNGENLYEAAYENPSAYLSFFGSAGGLTTTYGMKPGTHPTITLIQ